VPGCGLAPNDSSVDVSCKLTENTIGIGQQATFNITYNSAIAGFVKSAEISDGQGAPSVVEGAGTPEGSDYKIIVNRTYSTAFSGKPTATLLFTNNKGGTLPVNCDQLSVGASTTKVSISGNETLLSGETGEYEINVSNPTTDASFGITSVSLYALHADGSPLTSSECGPTFSNGVCRIYNNSNLQSLQKEFTKSNIKWKPTLATAAETDYYLYATVNTNSGTCSGIRGASKDAPCSGQSNLDVTVGTKSGYTGYIVAASLAELADSPVRATNITSWPQEVTFPPANSILNSWQTPGPRTIYVKFLSNTANELVVNRSVELVAPDPEIRAVSCNIGADGKNLSVSVRGNYFGQKDGKLTLNGSPLSITQWKTNQASTKGSDLIVGTLNTTATTNQNYDLELSRADGSKSTAKCNVGVSTLNLGAKVFCRGATATDISNVDLVVADGFDAQNGTKGKVTKSKVTIGADGTVKGLNAILQTCNYYKLSLKTPTSLRKTVQFQAADGATIIPDFNLPIGDIFPVNGGDGAINSFDVAELIRQWSASPASVRGQSTATNSATTNQPTATTTGRSADFNQDGVVNSFDFSCLVKGFNQSSDPEPTPGAVNVASVGDFCEQDQTDENIPIGGTTTTTTPSPAASVTTVTSSPTSAATTIPTISPSPAVTLPVVSSMPDPVVITDPSPVVEPSATLKSLTIGQLELNTANNFSGQIDLNQSLNPKTGSTELSAVITDSKGNVIGSKKAIRFIVKNYVRTDNTSEPSAYNLSGACQPDGSVRVSWQKQADKRYKAVMFDCTNESSLGSCDPASVVGSTEYSGVDTFTTPSYIAEALPDGNTQKLSSGGNYPGNAQYNVFQTQQNRRYSIQLYEREQDNSNPHAITGISTAQFKCSTAKNTFVPSPTYASPNNYGLEVSCQKDGSEIDALWWTFGKNGVVVRDYDTFKAVAYDCTYDTTPDCSDGSKFFIAGETPYAPTAQILNAQKFSSNNQTMITRPGHRYLVQLFARNSAGGQVVLDNATANISCR
jgi:hypothetical protein